MSTQSGQSGALPSTIEPRTTVVVALFWGALLGLYDACDTLMDFGGAEAPGVGARVVVTAMVMLAATSVLVGAALDVAGAVLHLRWDEPGLYRRGTLLVPRRAVLSLSMAWVVVIGSLCYIAFPVQPPFGLSRLAAGLGVAVVGTCLGLVIHRFSRLRWVERVGWGVVGFSAFHIEVDTLYQFSRLWPTWSPAFASNALMSFSHTLGLVGLLGFFTLATFVVVPAHRLRVSHVPAVARCTLIALAAVVFVGARPLLARMPEQVGVLLYERSVLGFRSLEVAPRFESSALLSIDTGDADVDPSLQRGSGHRRVRGVVVLMVDALRADMLDTTVNGQPVAPNLRRFGQSAAHFSHAYCTVPATEESVAAMMTGFRSAHLEPGTLEDLSLGPLLRPAGVETAGIYGHVALLGALEHLDRAIPFGDGPTNKHRLTADLSLAEVQRQLDAFGDRPFFLFAHFYDPHSHYLPNPEFDFGDSPREAYMAEVAYADRRLGQLFDHLHQRGLDEEIAVVVVSDHGEELGEHGYHWHRKRVYEESARVVLQIRVPWAAPRVLTTPVSLLDLAPTVLDLLGAPIPEDVDGISLVPVLDGGEVPRRRIVVTAGDQSAVAIIEGRRKLILNATNQTLEYFDLLTDPHERHNLADERPLEVARMVTALRAAAPAVRGQRASVEAPVIVGPRAN